MRTPEHAAAPGGQPGAGAIVDDDTTSVSAGATFQLLPALSVEEFEALKADIAAHGVHHPIEVDEHGRILDGHHRHRACTELGIDPPLRVVSNLDTDQDKRSHALRMNLSRRHLTRDQKRQVIAASITADPDLSDREHARRLGCSPTTVGTVRRELSAPQKRPAMARAEAEQRLARIHAWLDELSETLRVTSMLLTDCGVPFAVADEMVRQLDRDVREMVCSDPPNPWAADYIAQRFDDVLALVPGLSGGAR